MGPVQSLASVCLGAAFGCAVVYELSLTPSSPTAALMSPLMRDLLSAYQVGVIVFAAAITGVLALEWRLFLLTGFCVGLTSHRPLTMSAVAVWHGEHAGSSLAQLGVHLLGFTVLTYIGYRQGRYVSGQITRAPQWLRAAPRPQDPPEGEN